MNELGEVQDPKGNGQNPEAGAADPHAAQELRFESEEKRIEALNALPDEPPMGVPDPEAWYKEQESLQERIQNATIGDAASGGDGAGDQVNRTGPGKADPAAAPATPAAGDDWYKAEDWTYTYKGKTETISKEDIPTDPEFTFKNPRDATRSAVNAQKYIKQKMSEHSQYVSTLKDQIRQMEEKQKDMQARLNKAETTPSPTASQAGGPAASSVQAPSENDIKSLQSELGELDKQLDQMDDDDPEAIAMLKKSRKLDRRLQSLKDQRWEYEREQAKRERDQFQVAEQKRIEEQKKLEAQQKADRKRQEEFAKTKESIENFRKLPANKAFASPKSYTEMEKDYLDFSADVAALYFGKSANEVSPIEKEVAISKYLDKNPALLGKMQETGMISREPKELRQYLILSEVDLLRVGKKLDPNGSGKWVDSIDPLSGRQITFPDFESAYDYWKRINGVQAQDRIDAFNKGAEEAAKAMAGSGATEIPSGVGKQPESAGPAMTTKEALENIKLLNDQAKAAGFVDDDEWIEELSSKNPNDARVKIYERSVEALSAAAK